MFCRIVSGDEKSWIVIRTRPALAILDRYPLTRGHTLIIPTRHYESMFDIPEKLLGRITFLAKRICKLYESRLSIQGVSIEVMNHRRKQRRHGHFHLHVIPRYDMNDKRDPANVKPSQTWPRESDSSLNKILSEIRQEKKLALRTRQDN